MKSIFDPEKPIDESNFLQYDVRRLKNANSVASYREGIDSLVSIRDTLKIVEALGRIQELGYRNFYIEALRWLKGETELTNWHHVPRIPDIEIMTIELADGFKLYTDQLKINLRTESLYSLVETTIKVAPLVKSTPITKRVEQSLDVARDRIAQVASERIESIQSAAETFDTKVQATVDGVRTVAEERLENRVTNANEQINSHLQNAISQVQQATALRNWGEVYDENIIELNHKLYGHSFRGVISRNASSLMNKSRNFIHFSLNEKVSWGKLFLKIVGLIIKNSWSFLTIIISKLTSISGRRSISFLFLVAGAAILVVLPVLEVAGITHFQLFNPKSPTEWLTKVVIFLPLVVILSIAYSFTTKNYRIYANMLDQYKHRRAVARTAQGIIISTDSESEADRNIRNAMTAAAATALFEHKVTGHLSKKEVESLGLLDVIRSSASKS